MTERRALAGGLERLEDPPRLLAHRRLVVVDEALDGGHGALVADRRERIERLEADARVRREELRLEKRDRLLIARGAQGLDDPALELAEVHEVPRAQARELLGERGEDVDLAIVERALGLELRVDHGAQRGEGSPAHPGALGRLGLGLAEALDDDPLPDVTEG